MGDFRCCMNCEKRHPMCHDQCTEYLERREKHLLEKQALREHYMLGANEFNRNAFAFNKRGRTY